MAKYVNLDAMIPREDFEVDNEGAAPSKRPTNKTKRTNSSNRP